MTTQTSTENSVDSKKQEQLKKITHKLAISAASYMADNLTVSDLKFLFEHFAPLQELIRALVAAPAGTAPAALVDDMRSSPDIWPNWRSSGAVTVRLITSGLAPGYRVWTWMVG